MALEFLFSPFSSSKKKVPRAPPVVVARTLLKRRLSTGYVPDTLAAPIGLEAQAFRIEDLITKALEEEHKHEPFLLIGERGSGKSLCLEHVLKRLQEQYTTKGKDFDVVYINGLLENTDAAAVRAISAQLETGHMETGRKFRSRTAVTSRQVDYVLDLIRASRTEGRPLVFVIDHIQEFAKRPRQLLLYSLVDLQHRQDVKVLVVGLSNERRVLDMFEKRVRSRLSNKQVFFEQTQDLDTLMQILDQLLTLPTTGSEVPSSQKNHAINFNAEWRRIREDVSTLLAWPQRLGRPVRWFTNVAYRVVSHLDEDHPYLTQNQFYDAVAAESTELTMTSKSSFASLANPELLVIIAMKRLTKCDKERCNLDMIWKEYEAFLKQEPLLPCRYSRPVLHKGLLNVLALGLIRVCQRVPEGSKTYLEYVPPSDKCFLSLDAGDLSTAPLCVGFDPADLEEFLKSPQSTLPTLLVRWGSSWTE